jgi:excisionase family DNA binding protein
MNAQEVENDWLTPAEVAKRFHVSVNTVYTLLNSGRALGAIRVGNQWRLSRTALETALSVWGPEMSPPAPISRGERQREMRLRARRMLSGEARRR